MPNFAFTGAIQRSISELIVHGNDGAMVIERYECGHYNAFHVAMTQDAEFIAHHGYDQDNAMRWCHQCGVRQLAHGETWQPEAGGKLRQQGLWG